MREVWIIDVVRTPRAIGKIGKGAYSDIHPQRILATVLRALERRNSLQTADIDDVIVGCSTQAGKQARCIGRMACLDAGWPAEAPGFTLDRFCGSGLTAVNLGAMGVMSGMQELVVAAGVESMSHTGTLGGKTFLDCGNLHLRELHPMAHQGICADLIATLEGINRQQADEFAIESQRRADLAIKGGHFERSLVPVYHDDGQLALAREQFPRPESTLEGLGKLQPSFVDLYEKALDEDGTTYRQFVEQVFPNTPVNHIHHAGNSSGVVDGAAAVLLASPQYAQAHGYRARARIRAVATAGDNPELMLNAPGPAARKVLKAAQMELSDIDLFEVNEAFAVVPIKFMRDLDVDHVKLNVNGGAIALGHPIGATGVMLVGTVLDELERRGEATGLVTLCTGGGMAPALILERF
jgi:acetyl-CoA C-acetyltransferase